MNVMCLKHPYLFIFFTNINTSIEQAASQADLYVKVKRRETGWTDMETTAFNRLLDGSSQWSNAESNHTRSGADLNINPSIFYTLFLLHSGSRGPVHCRATKKDKDRQPFTHTQAARDRFRIPDWPHACLWTVGGKPGNPERHRENIQLHTEKPGGWNSARNPLAMRR